MRAIRSLFFAIGMATSIAALAAGQSWKEPVSCVGPYQGYLFSWLFEPDNQATYWPQARRSGSSNPWTYIGSSSNNASDCRNVGMGLPLGTFTHVWRVEGSGGPGSPINSTETYFVLNDDCEDIP